MSASLEQELIELRRRLAAQDQLLQAGAIERDESLARLAAARDRQAATADILSTIAGAPGDADRALQLIAETSARLFGAASVSIQLAEGEEFVKDYRFGAAAKRVASANPRSKIRVGGRNLPGTVVAENRQIHIPDLDHLDPSMSDWPGLPHARAGGTRTMCGAPLRRQDKAFGALIVYRDQLQPFTSEERALLQTFADQAVIAIENARLMDSERQRAHELGEALERQTATAEILRAISESPTDAQPVFDRIVVTAARLLRSNLAFVMLTDGREWWGAALASPEGLVPIVRGRRHPVDPAANFPARVIVDKEMLYLPDWTRIDVPGHERWVQTTYGVNCSLYLPLLRNGECIGLITLTTKEANAFGPSEVAQAESFRDQAYIAIENARLFNETREALERQTATAEILKVIASSPADTQPVFEAIVASARRLLNGRAGILTRFVGDSTHLAAFTPVNPEHDAGFATAFPRPSDDPITQALKAGRLVLVEDTESGDDWGWREGARIGIRSGVNVPLVSQGATIGGLTVNSSEPRAFDQDDIELLRTFADQAVIAIENARLLNETQEALQQQTATSEVLKVISRSAFDLQAVLDTLIASAVELCEAYSGIVFILEDGELRYRSRAGTDDNLAVTRYLEAHPIAPGRGTVAGRVLLSGAVEAIPDRLDAPEYDVPISSLGDAARSFLGVPLLGKSGIEGVIVLARDTPGHFPDRQIDLVKTFADQAVIAIENTRLFEEVQARTRDLQQALERQQASAEILRVISSSPTDVKPVFDAISLTAARLFQCDITGVFRVEGTFLKATAASFADRLFEPHEFAPDMPLEAGHNFPALAAVEKRTVYVPDYRTADTPEHERFISERYGLICGLFLPLMRKDECIGVFLLTTHEPNRFDERDIALAESFRDQAQIAIENTRLFNETQEALAQQTATADVLKVISRSAFDLQTVFNTLVSSAVELGGAMTGTICVRDGDVFRYRDTVGAEFTSALARYLRDHPAAPGRSTIAGRVLLSGKVERIPDCLVDPEYVVPMGELATNVRSLLGVPLLRKEGVEGAIILTRAEPGDFTDRQVEIVQTFADQAVIALENVRLFEEVQARTRELQESLAQQTATAELLKVISRSAFDLEPALVSVCQTAARLCEADRAAIFRREGDLYRFAASYGFPAEYESAWRATGPHPIDLDSPLVGYRALAERRPVQVLDVTADPAFLASGSRVADVRTSLGVPLMRESEPVGNFVLSRKRVEAFTPRHLELIQTFADQAVIAIENVRLFEQVQARTRELSQSLENLHKAQDRLVQSEKLASLGQLTAGIAHEIKNPLNFVNNFAALSRELLSEMKEALAEPPLPERQRDDVEDLMGMIDANLDKVVQHGQRADSIVKNMLLHSRQGSSVRERVDVNSLVEEALNLAYHGARADKPGFNVTIGKQLDPQAGAVEGFAQELTRVLLNLVGNGLYATQERKAAESGAYEPTLTATTRAVDDGVEIAIRDNGTGIPDDVKAKIFNPFFTTKPAGEGTGLGLSLSHDIIVKQHGGRIDVATEPGAFTEFRLYLPRGGAPSGRGGVA